MNSICLVEANLLSIFPKTVFSISTKSVDAVLSAAQSKMQLLNKINMFSGIKIIESWMFVKGLAVGFMGRVGPNYKAVLDRDSFRRFYLLYLLSF